MAVLQIILALGLAYVISFPYNLYRNYLIARKTELRIIISPLTPFQLPWQIATPLLGTLATRWWWFRALDQKCAWQDKNLVHEELGTCFMHVSPGYNMLCTSDPVAMEHVYKKMKDFIKPEVFKTLDYFGPNIITVNDEDWARHRKLTAPCFNERVSGFVWEESLRQAKAMLEAWLGKQKKKSCDVVRDSGTVALHVIAAAAFGERRDFHEDGDRVEKNHKLSFRSSLRTILESPVGSAIMGQMPFLRNPFFQLVLSNKLKKVQLSLVEFKKYMLEAIDRERQSSKTTSDISIKRTNLLNALVKAREEVNAESKIQSPKSYISMSDDELTGNMFMFAFAGHETTATTISYALAHLAINPDIQAWVHEELEHVIGKDNDITDYAKFQPRLKRTLAVMYETVRLFGVPPPWRDIATPTPQILFSNQDEGEPRVFDVPLNTQVSLNVFACHTDPVNFPGKPTTWDPRRWIQTSSSSSSPTSTSQFPDETLDSNNKAFFGWGCGPRICPGMKFAHVEFTAVMATILTQWKVVPALVGDSDEQETEGSEEKRATKEIERLIKESQASLAVNITTPEHLCLKLVER